MSQHPGRTEIPDRQTNPNTDPQQAAQSHSLPQHIIPPNASIQTTIQLYNPQASAAAIATSSSTAATSRRAPETNPRLRWSPEYLRRLVYSRRPHNLPPSIPYDENTATNIQNVPIEQLVPGSEVTTVRVVREIDGQRQTVEVKIGSRSMMVTSEDRGGEEEESTTMHQDDGSTTTGPAHLGQQAALWVDVPFRVSVIDATGERRDDIEWRARWRHSVVE